jgi:hypothetical protein
MARLQQRLSNIPPEKTFNQIGMELRIRQLTLLCEWLESCHTALGETE